MDKRAVVCKHGKQYLPVYARRRHYKLVYNKWFFFHVFNNGILLTAIAIQNIRVRIRSLLRIDILTRFSLFYYNPVGTYNDFGTGADSHFYSGIHWFGI